MKTDQPITDQYTREILERRAQALAEINVDANGTQVALNLITFSLGSERYAVPIEEVIEIQPLKNWAKIPCAPSFIIGAVNLRGRIYSLMDIARFIGLAERVMPVSAHVLLVRGINPLCEDVVELCLLADDRPQEINLARGEVDTTSSTLSSRAQEYIVGVTSQMLIVLDLKRLLASAEVIVSEEV